MSDDLAFISLTQNSVSEQQHQYEYTRDVQNIKLKAEKKTLPDNLSYLMPRK